MTYTKQALRRLRRRMTLVKLACRTQLPLDLLDRYEIGKGEITLEALFRIECALEVSVSVLMAEAEKEAA